MEGKEGEGGKVVAEEGGGGRMVEEEEGKDEEG